MGGWLKGEFETGHGVLVRGVGAQGDDGGCARAVDAEDGGYLGGVRGGVEGGGAVPEGEDGADCPVGRDDGAAVEGVEGEGVFF